MFTLSIAEGFARGLASLHAPPLLGRKSSSAKSRVSITSKLIETEGPQVPYFGHLRKTGGRGSYGLVHTADLPLRNPHGTKFNHSRTFITFSSRAPRYSFILSRTQGPPSPLFPLHTKSSPVTPLFPLLTQKQGSTPPPKMSARRHFRFFPIFFAVFAGPGGPGKQTGSNACGCFNIAAARVFTKVRRCSCEEDWVSPGREKSRRKGLGELLDGNVQYHHAGGICTSAMFGNFRILPEQAGVICAPGWRRD
jgi:hypothetical protein